MADTEGTVIIGSGRKSKFRDSHPSNNRSGGQNPDSKGPKRGQRGPKPPPVVVRVHNGPDNLVGEVTLRTLVRFSRNASEFFPNTQLDAQPQKIESSAAATTAQPKKNESSAQAKVENVPETSGKVESSTVETAPAATESKGKAPAAPPPAPSASTSTVVAKHDRQPVFLTYILSIDALLMPTNEAVQRGLSWMKSNARLHGNQPLFLFGPSALKKANFEHVLNTYQTALAFGIRPFPHHLRDDLIRRLDEMEPTLELMKMINECVPLNDVVVRKMMEMHDFCYIRRGYSQAEVNAFNDYIFAPGNEAFANKLAYVGRCRRRAHEARMAVEIAPNTGIGAKQNRRNASSSRRGRGRGGRGRGAPT